jgi:hypothetical protein
MTSIGFFSKNEFKMKVDNMRFSKVFIIKSLFYVYLKSDLYLLFKINQSILLLLLFKTRNSIA